MNSYWNDELEKYIEGKVEADDEIAASFRERFGADIPIVKVHGGRVVFTFEVQTLNGVPIAANLFYPRDGKVTATLYARRVSGGWDISNGVDEGATILVSDTSNLYEACMELVSGTIEEAHEESITTLYHTLCDWFRRQDFITQYLLLSPIFLAVLMLFIKIAG